jgi:hypothetical protein
MGANEEESERLRQYYKEAKAKGIDLAKKYLDDRKKAYRKMPKRLPLLWHTIMSKKYILPNYRQSDYVSQEVWDYFMFEMVYRQAMGEFGRVSRDEVMNTQWIGYIMNMRYGRPTYFLESELGEPMLANLPDDLELDEFKWQFPAMRVYLPKGLLTIKRNNEDCSLAYIDIVKVEKDVPYEIDRKLAIELIIKEGANYLDIPILKNAYSGMGVSGVLDMDCSEGPLGYAATTPIHETTIREVFDKWRFHELVAPIKSDDIDRTLTDSMLKLAFNILMIMGAYPIEYNQSPKGEAVESREDTIRPPKLEGKHMMPGLYKAKFIGAQLIRAKRQELIAAGKHVPTGQHVVFHWRKGHWKRVWYGPKKGQWRRQWIEMYSAGKEESS